MLENYGDEEDREHPKGQEGAKYEPEEERKSDDEEEKQDTVEEIDYSLYDLE